MKITRVEPVLVSVPLQRPVKTSVHDIRAVDTAIEGFDLCWLEEPLPYQEASAHLLAAAPNGLILEHMDWWAQLFDAPVVVENGHVVLSDRPGVGVALDPKALDRFPP